MLIRQIEMRELRMRLLHPFETSFGATQDRHIVLLKVSDGTFAGYGEVTAAEGPFYSYETWETAWHVLRDYIIPSVIGKEMEQKKQEEAFDKDEKAKAVDIAREMLMHLLALKLTSRS